MSKKPFNCIVLLTSFFAIILSCGNKNNLNLKDAIDIYRFDKALFEIHGAEPIKEVKSLHKNNTLFFETYFKHVLGISMINQDSLQYYEQVLAFTKHKDMEALYKDTKKIFPDLAQEELELGNGFKILKSYFPSLKTPRIYSVITALNIAAFSFDGFIGLGIDLFLGPDYPNYQNSGHPQYLVENFKKENICIWSMKTFLNDIFPLNNENSSLIDHMLHEGKLRFLLSISFPDKKEHEIMSFSQKELDWCSNNENEIWLFFIKRNLLFEKDPNLFMKFITEGPNTSGMPKESPGNIGSWLGYQIVKSYVKTQDNLNVPNLFNNSLNANDFLNQSKYKP